MVTQAGAGCYRQAAAGSPGDTSQVNAMGTGGRGQHFKVRGTVPPTNAEPEGEAFEPEPDDEVSDSLSDVLAELGDLNRVVIRVYKLQLDGTKEDWARCVSVRAENFDPDRIAGTYGPGRYKFIIVGADGKKRAERSLSFAAPVPALPLLSPVSAGHEATGAAKDSLGDKLLVAMIQQQGQLMAALVSSLGGGRGGSDIKAADMLEALRAGRELAAPSTPIESLMDAFQKGMSMGSGKGEEPPSGLDALAPRVFDLLGELIRSNRKPVLAQATVASAAGALPAAAAPVAAGNPSRRDPSHRDQAPGNPLLAIARQYAPTLLREAAAGRDPELWAAFIAERIPDAWISVVLQLAQLDSSERIDVLAQVNPELKNHREWIDRACKTLADSFEEEEPDDASGGVGTTADDPARRAGSVENGSGHPAGHSNGSGAPEGAAPGGAAGPGVRPS